jgi:putative aldouronate transport system permease protein
MVEKLTPSRIVFNILNYTFMIILCVICLAPLWHVMMASISDPRALMAASGLLFKPVGEITMRGYELVLQNKQILGGYVNTIIYVVGTTLLGTTLTIIGGFVLSRKTKLQVPFILIIIFTMMFNGGLIPSYMVNRTLGLINNRWAILIPGVINAFYIIIMNHHLSSYQPVMKNQLNLMAPAR